MTGMRYTNQVTSAKCGLDRDGGPDGAIPVSKPYQEMENAQQPA